MAQFVSAVTLVVDDYDRALDFYVNTLGFELVEDTKLSDTKRWVLVTPKPVGGNASSILLAKADGEAQNACIGKQTGGRVSFFLSTDQFDQDYALMVKNGVKFLEEPRDEVYAKVVVFEDPFGNQWDLLQPKGK